MTDISEDQRKGNPLPDHRRRLNGFSLTYEVNVSRDVYVHGTSVPARNNVFLGHWPLKVSVSQRPCGADLNAGAAEHTSRFFERWANGADQEFTVMANEADGLYSPKLSTSSHTATATYAQIVISNE